MLKGLVLNGRCDRDTSPDNQQDLMFLNVRLEIAK